MKKLVSLLVVSLALSGCCSLSKFFCFDDGAPSGSDARSEPAAAPSAAPTPSAPQATHNCVRDRDTNSLICDSPGASITNNGVPIKGEPLSPEESEAAVRAVNKHVEDAVRAANKSEGPGSGGTVIKNRRGAVVTNGKVIDPGEPTESDSGVFVDGKKVDQ